MNRVTVRPIGTARQGYRIEHGGRSFDVRTTSAKRYLVVSLRSGYVSKRTDDRKTAERIRRKDELDLIVIDRRIVDARSAGFLDVERGTIR